VFCLCIFLACLACCLTPCYTQSKPCPCKFTQKHRGKKGGKSIRLLADQQISLRQQTHLEKTNFFSKVQTKKKETNVVGCLKYLNRNLPAREKSLKVICQRGAMTAQPRPFPPPLDLSATTFVTLCLPFGCFSLSAKIKKKKRGRKKRRKISLNGQKITSGCEAAANDSQIASNINRAYVKCLKLS